MGRHSRPDDDELTPEGSDAVEDGADAGWWQDSDVDGDEGDPSDPDYADEYGEADLGGVEFFYEDDEYDDSESAGDGEFVEYEDDVEVSDEQRYADDYDDQTPLAPQFAAAAAAVPAGSAAPGRSHRSDGELTGSHRIAVQSRRGVSRGVVIALIAVVAVVALVIGWQFFGSALDDRSKEAAAACVDGEVAVAVLADPAIADVVSGFAEKFNEAADPVGDLCPAVTVASADSRAVVAGLTGEQWPADLGERPALWIPGSSASVARVSEALPQLISSSPSIATSPVLLGVRPELKDKLSEQSWSTLPGLATAPGSLDGLGLPGWGTLRLALPNSGDSDASFLAAEAVAADGGPGAVRTLVGAAPDVDSADSAFDALLGADPAAARVHAVATTEQRLYQRGAAMTDAADKLASWLPPAPVAVADFPAAQFKADWLSSEQVGAASQFGRFLAEPEQQAALAAAGFRVSGQSNPDSSVVDFGASIDQRLETGDAAERATVANLLDAPAGGSATSIMLDRSLSLDAVTPALKARLAALPPGASVGLTTFDGSGSDTAVTLGPLSDDVGGQPRSAALDATLDGLSTSGGGAVSFTTLRNVLAEAQTGYAPGQANSVLVITAGPHSDQSLGADGLLELVRGVDPTTPVAINVLNVGDDPDAPTWRQVAEISGGTYQGAPSSNSPEFTAALDSLLS
ncbi:substrate-binding domain-containing protein [Mycolicibacterium brumae]|uniref:VWFA domain-containing protein n=1 Tax=Mycolicibacterium brumae TaxID=85968 RepID=A0A2G5PDQ8_9MYCO|nr:substrate-binding domain-containing protein [Mycolicibacterium brumae]MCV7192858.1 substrate-binding domain-containing protein [Mycolicibacterium brumae]PIB76475.1 hypothetical protein CQY22_004950 [Mycolicibacterium brumae]RWA23448.1 hypothetical protein MBRU_01100 [Mycolicibacterium brumae DSM 44177]UWW08622.1 substrate-binding domain-containing protein [Mycolicibacterium brumae]